MKNIFLMLLFLLFGVNSTQAQTNVYHPFPDSGAYWRVNYYSEYKSVCNCGVFEYTEYYQYTLRGDTTIGAYKYHKLYTSGKEECKCSGYIKYFSGYAGGD